MNRIVSREPRWSRRIDVWPCAGLAVRSPTQRLRALLLAAAAVVVPLATSGCSASDDGTAETPRPTPAPGNETPATTVDPGGDPVAQACAAETAGLQAGLDRARDADTSAVLAVKNPDCGVRVLTSGPAKLTGTELHRIGSVTKTYVAAVVLTLAQEGALGLDDAVSTWVAGVPNGDVITLRQLLNHTSGLFNYTEDKPFLTEAVTKDHAWSPRALLDVAFKHPPYAAPGEQWHYSNTNYILLGLVGEAAGRANIGELVRSRVLAPIGAKATFFDGVEPVTGELALGTDARGNDMRKVGPSWAWAAGAMLASPADVVTWTEKLGSGAFYTVAMQEEVTRGVRTPEATMSYGLGMMILDSRATGGAGTAYGHAGDTPGYHTQAFYFKAAKTTIVSIVDSDAAPANDITVAALAVLSSKK